MILLSKATISCQKVYTQASRPTYLTRVPCHCLRLILNISAPASAINVSTIMGRSSVWRRSPIAIWSRRILAFNGQLDRIYLQTSRSVIMRCNLVARITSSCTVICDNNDNGRKGGLPRGHFTRVMVGEPHIAGPFIRSEVIECVYGISDTTSNY